MNKEQRTTVTFDAKIDEKDVKLDARLPNLDQQREGLKVHNRAFNDAVSSKALLRMKLDDFMKEQGLWDDAKQAQVTSLGKQIVQKEKALQEGGIKLSKAKEVAFEIKELRNDLNDLIAKRTELDSHTAEGQADNARFNYWVSVCLVYNDTQKPVFSSVEDYLSKANLDYAAEGAAKLAELLYNLNSNFENTLAENIFLQEFRFADTQNRLINKDGHLIDREDRLIDEEGYYVDGEGNRVDIDGNKLTPEGKLAVERKPFLDDEGEPIVDEPVKKPRRKKAEPAVEASVSE